MEGIQVVDRPASQSLYAVVGRLLFIESYDPELATLLERLFAGWQLTPVSFSERSPDVKISFMCNEIVPDIPPSLEQFEIAGGGRCHTASDEYYVEFPSSLLHLANGFPVNVRIWIQQSPDATDVELARVASFAACAALRRFGLFEIHSAAVVVPESKTGVLIIGPSGSGKSSLTLQLATAGWGYLSDDELLLSVADAQIEARGFRSFFAVAGTAATAGVELKRCFDPARVFASPPASRVLPRFLLFTSVSGESETEWRELTQTETMTRLLRACPWATYDTAIAAPNLELLSRLARQAKGFDLRGGKDLLDASRASQIIGSLCKA